MASQLFTTKKMKESGGGFIAKGFTLAAVISVIGGIVYGGYKFATREPEARELQRSQAHDYSYQPAQQSVPSYVTHHDEMPAQKNLFATPEHKIAPASHFGHGHKVAGHHRKHHKKHGHKVAGHHKKHHGHKLAKHHHKKKPKLATQQAANQSGSSAVAVAAQ